MNKKLVLQLIEQITPSAKNYFNENIAFAEVYYETEKGVFACVDTEIMCIFYACFLSSEEETQVIAEIEKKMLDKMQITSHKEICFNVYGENTKIIEKVRSYGFMKDMEGYVMKYMLKHPQPVDNVLREVQYEEEDFYQYVELFESAYYTLNIENELNPKIYSSNMDAFRDTLKTFHESDQLRFFHKNHQMIGAYLLDQNYIRDMVISPRFQNRGYGVLLLMKSIEHIQRKYGFCDVLLRVTKSNQGAKRFYERNGFEVIGNFSEHTYQKKDEKQV